MSPVNHSCLASWSLALVALVSLPGCPSPTGGVDLGGDAGPVDLAVDLGLATPCGPARRPDAADASDGGAPVACAGGQTPRRWWRETVAPDTVEVLGDPAQQWVGSALRLKVSYKLRPGCDLPGPVVVGSEMNRPVVVSARVWQSRVECAATPVTVTRTVSIAPGVDKAGRVIVYAPGAKSPSLEVNVKAKPAGSNCDKRVPLCGACQLSCECQQLTLAAVCAPTGPDGGRCVIPCDDDADCDYLTVPQCGDTPDGIQKVCVPATRDGCQGDVDCGPGRRCEVVAGGFRMCRSRPWRGTPPDLCTCDGACGAGSLCLYEGDVVFNKCARREMRCVMPCRSRADCEGNASTRDSMVLMDRVECVDGVCSCSME